MAMTRTELMNAFRKVKSMEFDDVPEDFAYTFSSGFEQRMDKLIAGANGIVIPVKRFRWKRALLVAAVIAFLLLSACAIPAVRAAVTKFFWGAGEEDGYYDLVFTDEAKAEMPADWRIQYRYRFSEIPEGFVLDYVFDDARNQDLVYSVYKDETGREWMLSQWTAKAIIRFSIKKSDFRKISKYTVGDKMVYILLPNFDIEELYTEAIWMENGYLFSLNCNDDIDTRTMLNLVELIE